MALDLSKPVQQAKVEAGQKLILDLKKKGMTRADAKSRVVMALDISGSTSDLYRKGLMRALATRCAAVALNLDDNGELDVIVFDSKAKPLSNPITERNIDTYIEKNVAPLVGGSTNYAPPLRYIMQNYGPGDPVFVIFVTDGEPYDEGDTEKALVELSYHGAIFTQFVGISERGGARFETLDRLNQMSGRHIDNAGLSVVDFSRVSDEELLAALLNEYPDYLVKARQMGILPWTKVPMVARSGGLGGLFGKR